MASNPSFPDIPISVVATDTTRRHCEPITCGIPFPKGLLNESNHLALLDNQDQRLPLQCQVLDRWHDGSIRWLLLDWQVSLQGSTRQRLTLTNSEPSEANLKPIVCIHSGESLVVRCGVHEFQMKIGNGPSILRCVGPKQSVAVTLWSITDEAGKQYFPSIREISLEESGDLRSTVLLSGVLIEANGTQKLADFFIRFHFFAGMSTVQMELTIRNSRKAEHPGGLWDLGNGGSIFVREASIQLMHESGFKNWSGICSPEPGSEVAFSNECELFQDSSGGQNWQSSNHVNRLGKVPLQFRGYRVEMDGKQQSGLRATPFVCLQAENDFLGIAVPEFWQNFPQALEARDGKIIWRPFPKQSQDLHELQGGEQKTYIGYLAFGKDGVCDEPLAWCRSPSHAATEPSWYCDSGVVPFLTPKQIDPHERYLQLVDAALDGPDTFAAKREVIDQFGWRHFGDIYGDHEAVSHSGPTPLVSHYNNQYDAIAGLGYQYLRSGDRRWFTEMHMLARHVIDIDIYHTDEDKSAYNHGLFWHTYHYVDAYRGTHRSYPSDARLPPHGKRLSGGGPANEQNYTTGLMLHYFLTGNRSAREAAIGLAQWVIDMDDGTKTVFRWLSRANTGLASKSRTPSYHGPGRGAANSIAALLDGHRLTGEQRFLEKAEQIIRRCIHPADDVEKRNLLDAENRWFYTMFLQSLGRYLLYKRELGQLDDQYAYARASLLKYARWMAEHEYPYLEKPEILEYPTQTWAAQDMRKCEIFNLASLFAEPAEAERFRAKADYFFEYSTTKLHSMPTRTLCRPVVLMLNFGFAHAWFKRHPSAHMDGPPAKTDFGQPTRFVPQKEIAMKRAKLIVAGSGLAFIAGILFWLFA